MDNNTLLALAALAQKLGTTAEYLWSALLRQAPITGTINLIVMAAMVAIVIVSTRFVLKKTTAPAATKEERFTRAEWQEEGAFGAFLGLGIIYLIVALIIGSNLSTTVAAFLNPEYWAMMQIIK